MEDILNIIEGTGRWGIVIIAIVVFLFFVARRKTKRGQLFEPVTKPADIIIDWGTRPGGQIPIEPWMSSPEIQAVFSAITKNGKEARFIGGCVRDAILKKAPTDIDLATQETPDQVIALLENAGITALPTAIEHGTVMAIINHQSYEITTLRKDIKTDGRHAVVEFTENWREDAMRRDFTINTMSATQDGFVYDYFNGMQDLANRVIRFVGRAPERIEEDYLRILRYFRFISTLGMRVENKSEFQACIDGKEKLKNLSAERIRGEFFKILASGMLLDVMPIMYQFGFLQVILPHVTVPKVLRQVVWLETRAIKFESVGIDPIRRLAALVKTDGDGVRSISDALKLSKVEHKRLCSIIAPTTEIKWDMSDDDLQAALYHNGAQNITDLAIIKWAEMLVESPTGLREEKNGWLHIIETADQTEAVLFPIKGQDVLELGIAPGPEVSRLLEQVEQWWCASGCQGDRDACLTKLNEVANK